jgi:hypothetical protein
MEISKTYEGNTANKEDKATVNGHTKFHMKYKC